MKYTCCLAYADEDEGMAQIITDLYTKASPHSLFFRPQWDLKRGKYIHETTARVIEERCDGKVVFLVSEYFLASDVCRFAVNFASNLNPSGDKGRLIPFLLTDNYAHIPTVLRGITGVKWHNTWCRRRAWGNLPNALYHGGSSSDLQKIQSSVQEEIQKDTDRYLGDPPYDDGIGPPREPIFSSDSDMCRAPSIENFDVSDYRPLTKFDKAKSWVSKKLRNVSTRIRRQRDNDSDSSSGSFLPSSS